MTGQTKRQAAKRKKKSHPQDDYRAPDGEKTLLPQSQLPASLQKDAFQQESRPPKLKKLGRPPNAPNVERNPFITIVSHRYAENNCYVVTFLESLYAVFCSLKKRGNSLPNEPKNKGYLLAMFGRTYTHDTTGRWPRRISRVYWLV
jgi:hypothetical protein